MPLKQYAQRLRTGALCSLDKAEQRKLLDWQRAKEYSAVLLKQRAEMNCSRTTGTDQTRTRHAIGKTNNAKNKCKDQRLHVHETQCLVNPSVTGVAHLKHEIVRMLKVTMCRYRTGACLCVFSASSDGPNEAEYLGTR